MQRGEVGFAAALGGQSAGFHLDDAACLQRLLHRAAGEHQHGVQRVGAGAHVGAIALAHFQYTGEGQHAHGLSNRIAAHAESFGQFGFGGQALAQRPGAVADALMDLLQGDVDQGALLKRAWHGNIQSSDEFEEAKTRPGTGSLAMRDYRVIPPERGAPAVGTTRIRRRCSPGCRW